MIDLIIKKYGGNFKKITISRDIPAFNIIVLMINNVPVAVDRSELMRALSEEDLKIIKKNFNNQK